MRIESIPMSESREEPRHLLVSRPSRTNEAKFLLACDA